MSFGGFVRARLHRRIFAWFGASIFLTAVIAMLVMLGFGGGARSSWNGEYRRIATFTGGRFARVWSSPDERAELARAIAKDLDLDVRLVDASGAVLDQEGAMTCGKHVVRVPVEQDGSALGAVEVCADRHHAAFSGLGGLAALVAAAVVLWAASGKIARRLSQPIADVARAAEEIGSGNFGARVAIPRRHRHHHGEAEALARSINTMAERIEKQFRDQKALLAAVSHEIRTPLARVRLLLELLREKGVDEKELAEIDREATEMDALVAELLASSRIEFSALALATLDAVDQAKRALERAGEPASKLAIEGVSGAVTADPTLVARALANLVANAKAHGRGLVTLRVRGDDERVTFLAEDAGPGFAAGEESRAFEPFFRGANADGASKGASLGLGLALVRRIADAHGGRAWAKNDAGGGACVGFELPRAGRAATAS